MEIDVCRVIHHYARPSRAVHWMCSCDPDAVKTLHIRSVNQPSYLMSAQAFVSGMYTPISSQGSIEIVDVLTVDLSKTPCRCC
jgi:hypothetical protein